MTLPVLKLRARKPALGKFFYAVAHVHTAKDSELEHLCRCQLWLETRVEIAPRRLGAHVAIDFLHLIPDHHSAHICPTGYREGRDHALSVRYTYAQ